MLKTLYSLKNNDSEYEYIHNLLKIVYNTYLFNLLYIYAMYKYA